MGKHRSNDLLHPFFTTRWLQWRQRPLSLSHSLSLSLSHSRYTVTHYTTNAITINNTKLFCPKSYLYTYDFRAIYTYDPKRLTRTHSRMCPFQTGREDHQRVLDHPVLLNFPSGGTCFPTRLYTADLVFLRLEPLCRLGNFSLIISIVDFLKRHAFVSVKS